MYGSIVGKVNNLSIETAVQYQVMEKIDHPHFSQSDLVNDIALLRVKPILADSHPENMFPVCTDNSQLERFDKNLTNSVCYVAGYGVIEEQPNVPNFHLNYAPMTIVDWKTCNETNYPLSVTAIKEIHQTNYFCAGEAEIFDSCSGDSGGPLMCRQVNSCSWTLVGLVSFGPSPCGTGYGVYLKLSEYSQFIAEKTGIEITIDPIPDSTTQETTTPNVTVETTVVPVSELPKNSTTQRVSSSGCCQELQFEAGNEADGTYKINQLHITHVGILKTQSLNETNAIQ